MPTQPTAPSFHATMLHRSRISAPMRFYEDCGLLTGRALDYGCGLDPHALPGYDPFVPQRTWHPNDWRCKDRIFDTVCCNYVLNVVEDDVVVEILEDIADLIQASGQALITVRADLKTNSPTQFFREKDLYLRTFGEYWTSVAELKGSPRAPKPSHFHAFRCTGA